MNTEGGGVRIEIGEAKAKLESGEAVALDLVQPQAWDQIESSLFVKRFFG